jgi:FkbM family methyltransferase
VREFKGVEGWIRKHFYIYQVIRRSAPFLCKYFTLEEGFDFLGSIEAKSPDFHALDVGANDGTSIRMIQQYLSTNQIVAFDPITKPRFKTLNVDFRAHAVGEKAAAFEIFTPTIKGYELTQYSSFDREKLVEQVLHDLGIPISDIVVNSRIVKVIDLDSLSLTPYFIKIDVEGFELEVIKGALATITSNLPVILIEIQSGETFIEVQRVLQEIGYVSLFVNPKKNLTETLFKRNICEHYDPNFNNYVWIPTSESPSWEFRA